MLIQIRINKIEILRNMSSLLEFNTELEPEYKDF